MVVGPDGTIYGTAARGGAYGFGSLLRIDAAGALSQPYSFNDILDVAHEDDAIDPGGQLVVEASGTISGIARGRAHGGEIYRLDNGVYTTLYAGSFTTGFLPAGGLAVGPDGQLRGANQAGGTITAGTFSA